MPRVVHFEINADEPERAVRFYKKVFGWKIEKWEGPLDYWLIQTGEENEPGINGAIMKRRAPNASIYNTIEVPSIDEFIKKIETNSGVIVAPKMTIPGVGYIAYFKDTEGNTFAIIESRRSTGGGKQ